MHASYLSLLASGELAIRIQAAYARLESCDICPLRCGVNRLQGDLGVCKTGVLAQVSSYGPHPGEERPLSGWRGSGTIFFARCNLRCAYCQNADISQLSSGQEVSPAELAGLMLELQGKGCHNINLVSPSHVLPQILAALELAAQGGLTLPLVYNTGGYDSLETLTLLDGVVDIYMPDMKYDDAEVALKYSKVRDYPQVNQAAVLEMQRQVGDLMLDEDGIARRGLLVRHLVLPGGLAGSDSVFKFLAEEVSKNVYLNIMAQYRPAFNAWDYPELNRRIRSEEYRAAIALAKRYGLMRLDE
ncbi:MAG: radical SAM protein [Brevefilum sp.]|nr:radical SAM protein [Brevefilum sp.]